MIPRTVLSEEERRRIVELRPYRYRLSEGGRSGVDARLARLGLVWVCRGSPKKAKLTTEGRVVRRLLLELGYVPPVQ